MKRGITPVVSIVLLLIIAVAVVGMGYGFISGFFSTVTGKAAIISGVSSCNAGDVTIVITNAGEDVIDTNDIQFVGTGCSPSAVGCPNDAVFTAAPIAAGSSAKFAGAAACVSGSVCTFDVAVAGVIFPTRAEC